MADITVQTDDGRTLVFPEGTPKEEMASALTKLPPLAAAGGESAASDPESTFRQNHPFISGVVDLARQVEPAINPVNITTGQLKGAGNTAYQTAKLVSGGTISNPAVEEGLAPKNAGENIGKYLENAAEFILGDAAAAKLVKPTKLLTRAATSAATGYGVTRAEGGSGTEATVNAAVGGGLPILFDLGGAALSKLGAKMSNSMIRPNASDVAAGYNVENLHKYGLSKMSLKDTLDAVHNRIVSLADDLRSLTEGANAGEVPEREAADGLATMTKEQFAKANAALDGHFAAPSAHESAIADALESGKSVEPHVLADYPDLQNKARMADIAGPKIDLNEVIDSAEERLLARAQQLQAPADEIRHLKKAISSYRSQIRGLPGGPEITIDEAQTYKRAVGLKGAWEYGKTAADNGMERVSNAVYQELRPAIERATEAVVPEGQQGVKAINKKLGELMPIEQAIVRRMPVAARNNPLSLTDLMLLATGHPVGAAAHVLSRTMAGATLTRAGANVLRTASPLVSAGAQAGVSSIGAIRRRRSAPTQQDQP